MHGISQHGDPGPTPDHIQVSGFHQFGRFGVRLHAGFGDDGAEAEFLKRTGFDVFISGNAFADFAAQAVGADDKVGGESVARGEGEGAGFVIDAGDAMVEEDFDLILSSPLDGFGEQALEIRTVDLPVREAVGPFAFGVLLDFADEAVVGVAVDFHCSGLVGHGAEFFFEAQGVDYTGCVGVELDAGADLGEGRGGFEDCDFVGEGVEVWGGDEGEGGGEAGDSGADDFDVEGLFGHCDGFG